MQYSVLKYNIQKSTNPVGMSTVWRASLVYESCNQNVAIVVVTLWPKRWLIYSNPKVQLMPCTSTKMTGCHAISHLIQSKSWPYSTWGRSHGLLNSRFKSTFSLQYGHVCFLPMMHQPRIQNSWNTWWHDNLNVFSKTPASFSLINNSFPQTAHTFCSRLRIGIPDGV